ncbi:MAG: TetR/AcrR family transcriptional regulator [Burkholderiaceae bacterium]|nr:TetR/AcrR family transcriptional regulator [Roseateles sp.]MBV8471221.1 TetR/AcrR family transcriptional regulator [Burkholderiaceae bacterium]
MSTSTPKKSTRSSKPIDDQLAPRRLPTQARGQQSRELILRAAAEVIEAEGLDRLTTKRIATAAGVSVGSVYQYFPNKEAVVCALTLQWLGLIRDKMDAMHPSNSGVPDVLAYLDLMSAEIREIYVGQPGLDPMINALYAIPSLNQLVRDHDEAVAASMSSAFKMLAPQADPLEIEALSYTLLVVFHELTTEMLLRRPALRQQIEAQLRACALTLVNRLTATS